MKGACLVGCYALAKEREQESDMASHDMAFSLFKFLYGKLNFQMTNLLFKYI